MFTIYCYIVLTLCLLLVVCMPERQEPVTVKQQISRIYSTEDLFEWNKYPDTD